MAASSISEEEIKKGKPSQNSGSRSAARKLAAIKGPEMKRPNECMRPMVDMTAAVPEPVVAAAETTRLRKVGSMPALKANMASATMRSGSELARPTMASPKMARTKLQRMMQTSLIVGENLARRRNAPKAGRMKRTRGS